MRSALPYGSWPTPITSELVVRAAARLGEVAVDGAGRLVVRGAARRGRPVGDRAPLGRRHGRATCCPPPWNARTRVHEYGGGAWTVSGGTLWFTEFSDQRLYRLDPGGDAPVAGDPGAGRAGRGAARRPAGRRRDGVLAVRETHAAVAAARPTW